MSMRFRRFAKDEEGIAFIEFALCVPFLLALLLGGIEMTRFILINQKVEKTAATISDVISQGSTVSSSQLNTMIYAASQVMLPYTMGPNGYVIVSSVTQTGNYSISNLPRVSWQYVSSGNNGSWPQASRVGSVGGTAVLPGGLTLFDKDNIIVTEVFYKYAPIIPTNGVISNSTVYRVQLFKPRLGALSTLQ